MIIAGIAEGVVLIVLSAAMWHQADYVPSLKPLMPPAPSVAAVGSGALFALLMFACSGSPVMLGEEVANPLRNIGESIVFSVTAAGLQLLFAAYTNTLKLGDGAGSLPGPTCLRFMCRTRTGREP